MYTSSVVIFCLSSLIYSVAGNAIRFYNAQGCGTVYSGCESIGPNVCCVATQPRYSVSISKTALEIGIGWLPGNGQNCGINDCSAGGAGTICCTAGIPGYQGGSFYEISAKMMPRRSSAAQKCTSTQEPNVFGLSLGDGKHLQIGSEEAKAQGKSHSELHEAFQNVTPEDAHAWLLKNGAVVVSEAPITQTITSDSKTT